MRQIMAVGLNLILLAALYVFSRVQGGFFSWFLFYSASFLSLYEWGTSAFSLNGVNVDCRISTHRLTAGQSLQLECQIERKSFWPLLWVRLSVETQSTVANLPSKWIAIRLPLLSRQFSCRFTLDNAARGIYTFSAVSIETKDVFGWQSLRFEQPYMERVLVVPKSITVRDWKPLATELGGAEQTIRQRTEEASSVVGVRSYQPGDRLSRIHWPATARRHMLQAKEFERQLTIHLTFVIDAAVLSYATLPGQTFERALEICASLMRYAKERQQRFTLLYHLGAPCLLPTGSSDILLIRAMDKLAELQPRESTPFAVSLRRLDSLAAAGSTLVIISPALTEEVMQVLTSVRRHHPIEWIIPMGYADVSPATQRCVQQAAKLGVRVRQVPATTMLSQSIQAGREGLGRERY